MKTLKAKLGAVALAGALVTGGGMVVLDQLGAQVTDELIKPEVISTGHKIDIPNVRLIVLVPLLSSTGDRVTTKRILIQPDNPKLTQDDKIALRDALRGALKSMEILKP